MATKDNQLINSESENSRRAAPAPRPKTNPTNASGAQDEKIAKVDLLAARDVPNANTKEGQPNGSDDQKPATTVDPNTFDKPLLENIEQTGAKPVSSKPAGYQPGTWQELLKTEKFWKRVGLVVGILLVILILTFNLGLDRKVFAADISGNILGPNGQAVSGAEVSCSADWGTFTTRTADDGSYTIKNAPYGNYKCAVNAPGYQRFEEKVHVGRWENRKLNIDLARLQYSKISGRIFSKSATPDFSKIVVKVGDTKIDVDSGGNLLSPELPNGKQTFKIETELYKDITQEVTLAPGENKLGDFELVPAKDAKFTVQNWINNQNLLDVEISWRNQTVKSDANGQAKLIDLNPNDKLEVVVKKEGYNEQKVSIDMTQPKVEFNIKMVPSGRIAYTSDRDGKSNIYTANYDGTQETRLTDSNGYDGEVVPSPDGKSLLFYSYRDTLVNNSEPRVYRVGLDGTGLTRLSNLEDKKETDSSYIYGESFIPGSKNVYTEYSKPGVNPAIFRITVSNLDGSNPQKILDETYSERGVWFNSGVSIFSEDGSWFAYVINKFENSPDGRSVGKILESKLVAVNLNTKATVDVSTSKENGYINPISFDKNNSNLAYTTFEGDQEKLHVFNLATRQEKVFENLGLYWLFTQLSPDGQFLYFHAHRDSKKDIYRLHIDSGEVVKITRTGKVGRFKVLGNLLFFENEKEMRVLDLNFPGVDQKTGISTDFNMWWKFGLPKVDPREK
jgi:Tol biopolymer transport system component